MKPPYTKACVTGGAGFIGSHLVPALLSRNLSVTVLDNLSVGRAENIPPEARIVRGDILDEQTAREAIDGCDIVFHLAARVAIRSSFKFVVEDTMTNVAGTASVLRAAQLAGTVRKVITASSMAVYADSPERRSVDENHPTEPISPYGISKLAAERLTHSMCAHAGIQSVVLRLFNTYGAGQRLSPYVGAVTIFINKLRLGECPIIFGDGEQCRDFVHVEDVAAGFAKAMESDTSGETFNIGSGVPRSVNQLLESLNRSMNTNCSARHLEAVAGELRYSVADISKARTLLGYAPKHDFESSLGAVIDEISKEQQRSLRAVAEETVNNV